MSSIRQKLTQTSAVVLVGALVYASPVAAATYGRLIARGNAAPSAAFQARFVHVRSPHSFVLVVTEPKTEQLNFSWSVHCTGSEPNESGGASGRASVGNGHWVKRIRPNWIRHPVSCSGTIEGVSAASPVLARVFTK